TLLTSVKSAQADSFVEDAAADPGKYGLVQPRLRVTVTYQGAPHGLLFGKASKDGKVYASREGSTAVVLVSKTTFDDLNKKGTDLRDRSLTTLDRDKISYLEIQNANGNIKLWKTGENQWQFAN